MGILTQHDPTLFGTGEQNMTTETARRILSKPLPRMTKSEEIEHWYQFLCALPAESYLRDILEPLSCDIIDNIRNDFGFIDPGDSRKVRGCSNGTMVSHFTIQHQE